MEGVINLNKPPGISSARAVAHVKRLLPRGTKIGHAGTLDPFATGVLILLVGKATRQCEQFMSEPKQYRATVKLGATTETLDPTRPEIPSPDPRPPERNQIDEILPRFLGQVLQQPPIFSALKTAGRPAYALARKGKSVTLEPRLVRIDAIEILYYQWPLLEIRVDCGRGTYIRALARDLGDALAVGGYLAALERTRVGSLIIQDAVSLEDLARDGVEPHLRATSAGPRLPGEP